MKKFAPPPTKFGGQGVGQPKAAQPAGHHHAPPSTRYGTRHAATTMQPIIRHALPQTSRPTLQRMTVLFNHQLQKHQTIEAVGIAKKNGDDLKLFHMMKAVEPLKKSFFGLGKAPPPTETLHLIGHGSGSSFAGRDAKTLAAELQAMGMNKARFTDIVLHSCSTGSISGGIASQLSSEMDMPVTAPHGTLSLDGSTVYSGTSGMALDVDLATTTFTPDGGGYVPPTKFL